MFFIYLFQILSLISSIYLWREVKWPSNTQWHNTKLHNELQNLEFTLLIESLEPGNKFNTLFPDFTIELPAIETWDYLLYSRSLFCSVHCCVDVLLHIQPDVRKEEIKEESNSQAVIAPGLRTNTVTQQQTPRGYFVLVWGMKISHGGNGRRRWSSAGKSASVTGSPVTQWDYAIITEPLWADVIQQ